MNYAQEGLEANEVDNSLTITNAAPEYIVAQQKELQQQLAEIDVQQKELLKLLLSNKALLLSYKIN